MGSNPMQMIVVLVSEGRNFPKRPAHLLVFEAKFDGELLSTDGVEHVETPEVVQELAWQINKKNLQQHRLQRTPIKILCYAVDTRSSAKELIGYMVIDVRSAPDKPVKKWYHLLNTKYKKSKPELKVAVYIEALHNTEGGDTSLPGIKNADTSAVDVSQLKPELNDVEGVFQLGPPDRCKDIFTLSVTVAFAANLSELLPNAGNLSIDQQGFYFFYTLFDNDVLTDRFLDLLEPKMTAERASVRIRTSLPVLRQYLINSQSMQFHLCTGDKSLGNATVSLATLLEGDNSELNTAAVLEGAFELLPPAKFRESPRLQSQQPVVGLSIKLKREEPTVTATQQDSGMCLTDRPNSPEPSAQAAQSKERSAPDTADDYSDMFDSEEHSSVQPSVKPHHMNNSAPSSPAKASRGGGSLTTTSEHTQLSTQPHHYEFTLQLNSIANVHTDHHIFIYLRYRYPAFGSSAPFNTHPAVEVRRGCEHTLSNSLCTMDFSMSIGELRTTLSQNPFNVELWQYDQMAGNKYMGQATLPLLKLLSSACHSVKLHNKPAHQRIQTHMLPVNSNDNQRIAELSATLCLSDFGELPANLVIEKAQSPQEPQVSGASVTSPTKTPEYRTALELEMWKESQEKIFEQQLKEKESRMILKLTEDFRKRDMERELLCKKKVGENESMQQELQKMIQQLTKRENLLLKKEREIQQLEADLRHSYDRKLLDLKESSRRLEQECDHKLSLSKSKLEDCEEQKTRLKAELEAAAAKHQDLEKEFTSYKEQQGNRPEVKLQSEINLLTLEKVELERRLEASNKSKAHYKQQWGRALKENAKLKESSDEEAKKFAQKQIQELELMKQRLFATEEREIIKSEKRELADIKEEINRQQKEKSESEVSLKEKTTPVAVSTSRINPALEEQLKRLQEERDGLLRTGVFNTEDEIILEIERRIRAVIQSIDTET